MKKRLPLILILAAALGAGAWMLLRPPEMPAMPSASASAPDSTAAVRRALPEPGKLAATAVLAIDPRTKSRKLADSLPARASVYREFLGAKQLKPLYDRLKATADGQTPEGWYVLYEILRKCATITDADPKRPMQRASAPKREDFVAGISQTDPLRDRRIAAFDAVETNRCAGFEGVTVAQADLNKLLADSASAGDPKARAVAIEQEIWQMRRAEGRAATLSDAQVESLRQVLGTRDPEALVIAGRLLSNSWRDFSIRIGGADGQIAEPRAFFNAWQLLACDYGYPCGADNTRVLNECAYQGHCEASTLQDYLYYYGSSPYDSQLLAQYQSVLRNAIETGDWSQVNVVRGPRPPVRRFIYGR